MRSGGRLLRICAASVAIVALLAAIACDDDDSQSASPTATVTATATARPNTPTAIATGVSSPQATPLQGTRGPVSGQGNVASPPALLRDVRAASHAGFDRVVFEFSGGRPDYRVEYVLPPIILDPSGQTVQVRGGAFLRVTFTGAAAHDDNGNRTFGSTDIMSNLPSILQVRGTGDFEAVLSWVAGLTRAVDFTVTTLSSPDRVVIDVAQP